MWVAIGVALAAYAQEWLPWLLVLAAVLAVFASLVMSIRRLSFWVFWPLVALLLGAYRGDMAMTTFEQTWPIAGDRPITTTIVARLLSIEPKLNHRLLKVEAISPFKGVLWLRDYAFQDQEDIFQDQEQVSGSLDTTASSAFRLWEDRLWEIEARLKRPQYSENPGGFSYERYLYRQQVVAVGTVKSIQPWVQHADNGGDSLSSKLWQRVQHWIISMRASLWQRIQPLEHSALIKALWLGDRSGLSSHQREVIERAGVQHLLVVSGMHLSAIAGCCWLLAAVIQRSLLWRYVVGCQRHYNRLAFILLITVTGYYALLCGFSIAVGRALVMLWLALWALSQGIHWASFKPWSFALALAVLLDPFAVFDAGLYLSFTAVWVLLLRFMPKAVSPRITQPVNALYPNTRYPNRLPQNTPYQSQSTPNKSTSYTSAAYTSRVFISAHVARYARTLLVAQLSIAWVMTPLMLWLDLPLSWRGVLINLWAIPWVSLWLLPVSGVLLLVDACTGASFALTWLDQQMGAFWHALEWSTDGEWKRMAAQWLDVNRSLMNDLTETLLTAIHSFQFVQLPDSTHQSEWLAALLLLTALAAFIPKALFPRSALGLLLVVSLWLWVSPGLSSRAGVGHLDQASFDVHVLDVGQGLSVLIRTQKEDWLVDTGPGYPSGLTQWQLQIAPYLQRIGVDTLHAVVISHSDQDHAGGVEEIKRSFAVKHWITPTTQKPVMITQKPAMMSTRVRPLTHEKLSYGLLSYGKWQTGQVRFQWFRQVDATTDNEGSWLLLVESPNGTVLLPGDISAAQEQVFLQKNPLKEVKSVQLLLAPHHGSRTSSSWQFMKALNPYWVVFSAGYANAYRHPHPQVVARYQAAGSRTLSTFASGLMVFRFDAGQSWKAPSLYRTHILGRWQRQWPLPKPF